MCCVILPTTNIFLIFVNIQKVMNTFNLQTNPIWEIYFFYLSYTTVTFFDWQINTCLIRYKNLPNSLNHLTITSEIHWENALQVPLVEACLLSKFADSSPSILDLNHFSKSHGVMVMTSKVLHCGRVICESPS